MTAAPEKSWPPRIRSALRRRLAERNMTIPKGLIIQYGPLSWQGTDRTPWIGVSHRLSVGESYSLRDMHMPFNGGEDMEAVLTMAERHILIMTRRDAREAAILAAGHTVEKPPLHMVEGSPLTVLAMELLNAGLAGIKGEVLIQNGLLEMQGVRLYGPAREIEIWNGRTFMIDSDKQWPETVLTALVGQQLHNAVQLPTCGRADVDDAIANLTINSIEQWSNLTFRIEVNKAEALPASKQCYGENMEWLKMDPVPLA